MSLVRAYASFLRNEQQMHAVWPPLVTAVEVGDYGVFHEGVFQRLGNVRDTELGVDPAPRAPKAAAKFELQSSTVRVLRHQAGAKVPAFELLDVAARLEIAFDAESAFFVKAASLRMADMTSPAAVAAKLRHHDLWRRSWKIVSKVYTGDSVVFLASRKKGTSVTFEGKASALAALEKSWSAEAGVTFGSSQDLALELRGKSGPIGVALFKLGLFGGVNPRDADAAGGADAAVEPVEDWAAEPEDDL